MLPVLNPPDRVIVARDEMTCTVCGETTTSDYCMRCHETDGGDSIEARAEWKSALVPTSSYLNKWEYEQR